MKTEEFIARVRSEITSGGYGSPGSRFATTRELAAAYGASLETASAVMRRLAGERLLTLRGKRYYVTGGYAPPSSPLGGVIAASRKNLLALQLNNIESPFFTALAKRIHNLAAKAGYSLITSDGGGDFAREVRLLDLFDEMGVRGVFTCPGLDPRLREVYARYPLPVVTLGRNLRLANCDAVLVDNYSAGRQVARHLRDCGAVEFAYVGLGGFIGDDPRLAGFSDMLAAMGSPLPRGRIITAGSGSGGDYTGQAEHSVRSHGQGGLGAIAGQIRGLLSDGGIGRPLGIFCYHDLLAAEVQRIVKNSGLERRQIPGEVKIAGFDGLPISAMVTPPLTTVSYRFDAIAERAAQVMLDYLSNPRHVTSAVEIQSSLTVRGSTAV